MVAYVSGRYSQRGEAWGSVVVKALRYKSVGPRIASRCRRGFSVASDSFMCPGVDSASKNEYQVSPGGKGSRCLRLTTYHLHVPMSPPGNVWAYSGLKWDSFTFTFTVREGL
jgi:hypothetical protein